MLISQSFQKSERIWVLISLSVSVCLVNLTLNTKSALHTSHSWCSGPTVEKLLHQTIEHLKLYVYRLFLMKLKYAAGNWKSKEVFEPGKILRTRSF